MPITPVKTPKFVKTIFSNYVWDIDTDKKDIYLTFDDGPTPEITDWTLDILEQYKAKATFFCIGANVEKYPEIFQNILQKGHRIGNHTQHHVKGWKTSTKNYLADTKKAQAIINSLLEHHQMLGSNLFRPPYGKITPNQSKKLRTLGYTIVMWDILSFDWHETISEENCLKYVISKAKQGSIIVFHDSVKASKNMQYALPKVLEYYSKKGYAFKSLK